LKAAELKNAQLASQLAEANKKKQQNSEPVCCHPLNAVKLVGFIVGGGMAEFHSLYL
jgi:hypothetical protein